MVAKLIDGKYLADQMRAEIKQKIQALGKTPCLAVILIGEHLPSQIYVRNKQRACEEVGIKFILHHFPENILQDEVLAKIDQLNQDRDVHGILVQLPLPSHFNQFDIINSVNPKKDVDGFSIVNVGKLTLGIESLVPCTALGCLKLIKTVEPQLAGKKTLIIGRSNIVGRPTAQLLLRENCTVTHAHSETVNLAEECRNHDLIVSAIGKPQFIKGEWLKSTSIVIDVGINRIEADGAIKITGDVEFSEAVKIVRAITPVPGGVGLMTIACLLENTLKAFKQLT